MTNRSARFVFVSLAKRIPLLACVFLALILVGCSSVQTHVDKGAINARTFSFINTGNRQTPNYAETSRQAHALVQQALINNLSPKGIAHAERGGDVTVAYLIIVGNNAATASLNDYFGYTDDSAALVHKVHDAETGTDKDRSYFEAGTLVIDFVDPKTSKLLQRRSIQAPVLRNLPMEQRSARVQTVVDQALANLPVSH